MFKGGYSWLMVLKNSKILFEDSRAERLSATCVKEVDVGSPGQAMMRLTCLIQQLFLFVT